MRTQVALLTVGDPDRVTGGYLFHRRLADAAQRHDAELRFVSIPAVPLAWALPTGPWWLRTPVLRDADVVVLDSIAAAAASPWLSRLRAPLVGMLHQPPGGIDSGQLARRVSARFDRWAYRRADVLMVASVWLAEQLVAGGVDRRRLRVVPPGKDPVPGDGNAGQRVGGGREIRSRPEEQERAAFRMGRRIAALCVANWLPRKGIAELLEAVAEMPDDVVTVHLVGDTAGGRYARRIRRRLDAPDLSRRIVVHGIVPATAVHQMYRAADVFVLPSFEEPYGTVWGEAMAGGLPVVGWRAGNLPFLADEGREGLMATPGDVAALAGLLERLANDPDLRRQMGQAAAERAAGRPTWSETTERFFEVIEEVRARRQQARTL